MNWIKGSYICKLDPIFSVTSYIKSKMVMIEDGKGIRCILHLCGIHLPLHLSISDYICDVPEARVWRELKYLVALKFLFKIQILPPQRFETVTVSLKSVAEVKHQTFNIRHSDWSNFDCLLIEIWFCREFWNCHRYIHDKFYKIERFWSSNFG